MMKKLSMILIMLICIALVSFVFEGKEAVAASINKAWAANKLNEVKKLIEKKKFIEARELLISTASSAKRHGMPSSDPLCEEMNRLYLLLQINEIRDYVEQKKYDFAEELFEKMVKTTRFKLVLPQYRIDSFIVFAEMLNKAKEYGRAIRYCEYVINGCNNYLKVKSELHDLTRKSYKRAIVKSLQKMADVYIAKRELDRAINKMRESLSLIVETDGKQSFFWLDSCYKLAMLHGINDERDEALELYTQYCDIKEKMLNPRKSNRSFLDSAFEKVFPVLVLQKGLEAMQNRTFISSLVDEFYKNKNRRDLDIYLDELSNDKVKILELIAQVCNNYAEEKDSDHSAEVIKEWIRSNLEDHLAARSIPLRDIKKELDLLIHLSIIQYLTDPQDAEKRAESMAIIDRILPQLGESGIEIDGSNILSQSWYSHPVVMDKIHEVVTKIFEQENYRDVIMLCKKYIYIVTTSKFPDSPDLIDPLLKLACCCQVYGDQLTKENGMQLTEKDNSGLDAQQCYAMTREICKRIKKNHILSRSAANKNLMVYMAKGATKMVSEFMGAMAKEDKNDFSLQFASAVTPIFVDLILRDAFAPSGYTGYATEKSELQLLVKLLNEQEEEPFNTIAMLLKK